MRTRSALLVLTLSTFLLAAQEPGPAPGQGQQPPPQPAPQPTPGREPGPGTQPRPGEPQQPRFPSDDMRDPFGRGRGISGKIVPSPSTRVRVDLYIDSMRLDTTFTDMDGKFRFERQQPGRRYEIHVDMGPNLEYVEEVDFSMNYEVMIHIRNQGIRRTGPGAENGVGGGTMISLASLTVPKNAKKEFESGQKARSKKKFDEALEKLAKATELYPKYAEAFNEIGLTYRNMNKPEDAQKAFEQAIVADPAWLHSYMNLGFLQLASNQHQQLLETSTKALKLHPTLSQAHFLQSVANLQLGHIEAAEKSALEADRHEHTQVPQIHLVLAHVYRTKGARADAAKHLRSFLKEMPNAPNAEKVKVELEQLKEK